MAGEVGKSYVVPQSRTVPQFGHGVVPTVMGALQEGQLVVTLRETFCETPERRRCVTAPCADPRKRAEGVLKTAHVPIMSTGYPVVFVSC